MLPYVIRVFDSQTPLSFTQSTRREGPNSASIRFPLPPSLASTDQRLDVQTCGHSDAYTPSPFPTSPLESTLVKLAQTTPLTIFRINTYKSVSKQMALSIFRINTYEK